MAKYAGTSLILTALVTLAPALSEPSAEPSTMPADVWAARGWLPAQRMCEMDGPTLPDVLRWRCVRSTDGEGWELQTQ